MLNIDLINYKASIEGELPIILAEIEFIINKLYKSITKDIGDSLAKELLQETADRAFKLNNFDFMEEIK